MGVKRGRHDARDCIAVSQNLADFDLICENLLHQHHIGNVAQHQRRLNPIGQRDVSCPPHALDGSAPNIDAVPPRVQHLTSAAGEQALAHDHPSSGDRVPTPDPDQPRNEDQQQHHCGCSGRKHPILKRRGKLVEEPPERGRGRHKDESRPKQRSGVPVKTSEHTLRSRHPRGRRRGTLSEERLLAHTDIVRCTTDTTAQAHRTHAFHRPTQGFSARAPHLRQSRRARDHSRSSPQAHPPVRCGRRALPARQHRRLHARRHRATTPAHTC